MNIIINTLSLKNSLQDIMGVVNKDLSTPILSHVLIEKNDGFISITGTDLQVQITTTTKYKEADDFEPITVSGRKLYEIVKSLDQQEVSLSTSKTRLTLRTRNSTFKFSTLPATKFIPLDAHKATESFKINEKQLLDLLTKTSFSMATNHDVRFILCGLLLVISPNALTAVATDAHRLAISSIALEKKQINNTSCILPRKAALELIRVLQGNNDVKVSVGAGQISFKLKGLCFVSKLMDGKFPAGYKNVIPDAAGINILLEKQKIRAALQRVSILANEKFKGVRVEATKKTIVLSSENPNQEEAKETLEHKAANPDRKKINAGFNSSYLIEAINACVGDQVVIGLNGPKENQEQDKEKKTKEEGTLIYSPSDNSTRYVVMPYKI